MYVCYLNTNGMTGDATFSHLGLDIQVNDQADHAMTDASTVRKAYIKQLTNKEYDATLSNLLIC